MSPVFAVTALIVAAGATEPSEARPRLAVMEIAHGGGAAELAVGLT